MQRKVLFKIVSELTINSNSIFIYCDNIKAKTVQHFQVQIKIGIKFENRK